jgi:hypothetical protein
MWRWQQPAACRYGEMMPKGPMGTLKLGAMPRPSYRDPKAAFDPNDPILDAMLRAMDPQEEYPRRMAMRVVFPECRRTSWNKRLMELRAMLVKRTADVVRYSALAARVEKHLREDLLKASP